MPKSASVIKQIGSLPALAEQKAWTATVLVSDLLSACTTNSKLKNQVIEAGIQILPEVSKETGWACYRLLTDLLAASGADAALNSKVVAAGLEAHPLIMTRNSEWVAMGFVDDLIAACKDDALKSQAIISGLENLVALGNPETEIATKFSKNLQAISSIEYEGKVIEYYSEKLAAIAQQDGGAANTFVEALAKKFGVELSALANCVGKTADGTAILISTAGGSVNRISFAFKSPGKKTISFVAGCFKGTGNELLRRSEKQHGSGTDANLHYAAFVEAAKKCLTRPGKLPALSEVMRERLAKAPKATPSI